LWHPLVTKDARSSPDETHTQKMKFLDAASELKLN